VRGGFSSPLKVEKVVKSLAQNADHVGDAVITWEMALLAK